MADDGTTDAPAPSRPRIAPRAQDFRSLTFTLAPGREIRAIRAGCRYLTIYKITAGAALEISENVDGWSGNWTPLPYGFTVGFTSERGVSFRNPATSGSAVTYTVLYGRGPFADNRSIVDPLSFDGTGTLRVNSTTSPVPLSSDIFTYYYLGATAAGSGYYPFYPGYDLTTYLNGRKYYIINCKFQVLVAGQILFNLNPPGTLIRDYTGLAAGTVIDTGEIYPSNGTASIDVYLGPSAQISYMEVNGRLI